MGHSGSKPKQKEGYNLNNIYNEHEEIETETENMVNDGKLNFG